MDSATLQECIQTAVADASKRGWEAVILVLVMVSLITLTGFIIRWLISSMDKRTDEMDRRMQEALARENRMAERLNLLEQFSQTQLVAMVDRAAQMTQRMIDVVDALKETLDARPCLLTPHEIIEREKQMKANP